MKYLICWLVDDEDLREPGEPETEDYSIPDIVKDLTEDFDEAEQKAVNVIVFKGAHAADLGDKLLAEYQAVEG